MIKFIDFLAYKVKSEPTIDLCCFYHQQELLHVEHSTLTTKKSPEDEDKTEEN